MPDPDRALESDVEAVRGCPLLASDVVVEGWRYHVEDGRIDQVLRS